MYCRHCGQPNEDGGERCVACQEPLRLPASAAERIETYLPFSILITVLCCMPLGVPAIVFSAQVGSLAAAGDLEGARRASKIAKTLCFIGLGLGLLGVVAYFGLIALSVVPSILNK